MFSFRDRNEVPLFLAAFVVLVAVACQSSNDAPSARGAVDPGAGNAAAGQAPLPGATPGASVASADPGQGGAGTDQGSRRVYSIAPRAWIFASPDRSAQKLGYLRVGASAVVRGARGSRAGCAKGWVEITPRGFVCLGRRATLDGNTPIAQLFGSYSPDRQRTLPYRYGTVRNPGPIYARLPTDEQTEGSEPGHAERMARWLSAGGEIGASYRPEVWKRSGREYSEPELAWQRRTTRYVPSLLQDAAFVPAFFGDAPSEQLVVRRMLPKAGFAFVDTFFHRGRRFGLSTRANLIPTDRLRPIKGSAFEGYTIGKDVKFPFAIVRSIAAKFRGGETAPYHAALPLTNKRKFFGKVLHYQTTDGQWISDRHASLVRKAKRMPAWGKRGEKWIDINLSKQLMTLYEGEEPVFATLVSSGEAGLADPESSTATKRGIFRIHTKHVTATMSSRELGEEFELNDVPYVQYFDKQGYALHGAYWHDRFGMPKSHGCINLSPKDARRLFAWTEPKLPEGWHGVLTPLRGTVIFVHP